MAWPGPEDHSAETVSVAREAGCVDAPGRHLHPPRSQRLVSAHPGHVTGRETGQLLCRKTERLPSLGSRVWVGRKEEQKFPLKCLLCSWRCFRLSQCLSI